MNIKDKCKLCLFHLIEKTVPLADVVSIGETDVVLDTVVVEVTVVVAGWVKWTDNPTTIPAVQTTKRAKIANIFFFKNFWLIDLVLFE